MEDFSKPKIVYGQFQNSAEYAFAEPGVFISSNEYLLLCPKYNPKCLVAFLNSKVIEWLLSNITGNLGGNAKIGQKSNFVKLSVPILPSDEQKLYATLVDEYIDAIQSKSSTSPIEDKIETMILEYYKFTEDEMSIIQSPQDQ